MEKSKKSKIKKSTKTQITSIFIIIALVLVSTKETQTLVDFLIIIAFILGFFVEWFIPHKED